MAGPAGSSVCHLCTTAAWGQGTYGNAEHLRHSSIVQRPYRAALEAIWASSVLPNTVNMAKIYHNSPKDNFQYPR